MDSVIVDIQLLLARIKRIEHRVVSDHRLIRACHKAARLVNESLRVPVQTALS